MWIMARQHLLLVLAVSATVSALTAEAVRCFICDSASSESGYQDAEKRCNSHGPVDCPTAQHKACMTEAFTTRRGPPPPSSSSPSSSSSSSSSPTEFNVVKKCLADCPVFVNSTAEHIRCCLQDGCNQLIFTEESDESTLQPQGSPLPPPSRENPPPDSNGPPPPPPPPGMMRQGISGGGAAATGRDGGGEEGPGGRFGPGDNGRRQQQQQQHQFQGPPPMGRTGSPFGGDMGDAFQRHGGGGGGGKNGGGGTGTASGGVKSGSSKLVAFDSCLFHEALLILLIGAWSLAVSSLASGCSYIAMVWK